MFGRNEHGYSVVLMWQVIQQIESNEEGKDVKEVRKRR